LLAEEGVFADQGRAGDALDDVFAGAEAVALDALVGDDLEDALGGVALGAGVGVAFGVAAASGLVAEALGDDVDDLHGASCGASRVHPWSRARCPPVP